MIKELLVSFKENLETKSSNPFFGTLLLVWIIKNWNLFYSLFNFDPKTSLYIKRKFIINHFKDLPLIETLLLCILKAFIIMIASYLLINLSRLIINFFEKKITPMIYKWTDKTSIVLKSVYDISEEERKRLEKKVDEERANKLKLQEEYEKLEKKFSDFLIKQQDVKLPENENIVPEKNNEINNNKVNLIFNKLIKEKRHKDFEDIAENILNSIPMDKNDSLIKEFVTLGLITPGNSLNGVRSYFEFTTEGLKLNEKLLFERLK
ncbi:hypothetical protein SAMN05192550_2698 [Flavobacterium glycines]|uniref:Uncharacterized protein n=1 Tax=Flavobacterium glycines TaxID=551990 RepID=A0A1B9DKY8_9FLAO|nr:hypothetical protein [Flavobacterium glycines]OCB70364.1 hypothetical protein FBGL_12430 [Flavobacterium glycines]GEL11590.1 hypothetical protein FGL01_23290 [Flavobacterium glycines]SDJ73792.1 hypothetical protein SAMN05192550_2698 [Flavobacterium glycines]